MAKVPNGVETYRKFQPAEYRAHERYRQTDGFTTTYSKNDNSRSLKTEADLTRSRRDLRLRLYTISGEAGNRQKTSILHDPISYL